jgi:hypothetical protein
MNVQGPGSIPAPIPPAPAAAGRTPGAPRPAAEPARAAAADAPTLWELLTPDERTFFQQLATLGQLTYGPSSHPDERAAAAPTGQRIDVRA